MVEVAPDTLTAVAPKKMLLADGLFRLIGERIVNGELPPGARIRDAQLAAELAVSRTPVREALQRLERLGLVTMYPSRYTEVTRVDPDTVASTRVFAGLQAGVVARLACSRLTDDEVDTAAILIERIPRTLHDPVACSQARGAVLEHLASRMDNPLQQALVGEARFALARALRTYQPPVEHHPALATACADLVTALRSRDPDAAERAFRAIYDVR